MVGGRSYVLRLSTVVTGTTPSFPVQDPTVTVAGLVDAKTEVVLDAQETAGTLASLSAEGMDVGTETVQEQLDELGEVIRTQACIHQSQLLADVAARHQQFRRHAGAESRVEPFQVPLDQEPLSAASGAGQTPAEPASPAGGRTIEELPMEPREGEATV